MKYHELPGDNVSIRMVDDIPYSLFVILGKHGLDTVGQVRRTSNEELLQNVGLTQKQLRRLRMWCPIDDVTAKANGPEMPATAMTLRDHFAAQAMTCLVLPAIQAGYLERDNSVSDVMRAVQDAMGDDGCACDDTRWVAKVAYQFADAMIAARNGGAD